MPLLFLLSVAAFVSAFSIRMIDPLVPAIAKDFAVSVETAAMLASAYTFPYAFSQPVLGPIGDAFGKSRVMKVCLGILAVSLALGAVAPSFEALMVARVLAGVAGGGIIPIAFAIIGDRLPLSERQVALSKLVMASQISILAGSVAGGIVATVWSWRAMFAGPSLLALLAFAVLLRSLPARTQVERVPFSLAGVNKGFRSVFASPLALPCLVGVFVEGVAMFGLLPFVAARLQSRGLGGLSQAGVVIGAMSVGGILFTFLVRRLLDRLGRETMMQVGGAIACAAFFGVAFSVSWWMEAMCFMAVGVGFFMLHNSLQAVGVELAPQARASGIAVFAFIFFTGQAIGPVVYRFALSHLGQAVPVMLGGLALLCVATWASRRLARVPAAN